MKGDHRIPSLDGLRAVAVMTVIACHTAAGAPAVQAGWPEPVHAAMLHMGRLGVMIFFVISGYLITSLLLREAEGAGRIDLWRFYFRRTVRIFPAFYAFVAVAGVLAMLGVFAGSIHLLPALTYTTNYFPSALSGLYGHSWSLAVEEQFYLLWPFVLGALGRRRAMMVAAGVVLAAPFIRVAVFAVTRDMSAVLYHFETVADALAVGCLLAGARPKLHAWTPYLRMLRSPWFVLVPIGVVVIHYGFSGSIRWLFVGSLLLQGSLTGLGIALCIDRVITYPGKLLNVAPIAWLGTISYSLYLWQQPFLVPQLRAPVPVAWAGILLCAVLSYYLVERPALRLRPRWEEKIFGPKPAPASATRAPAE